VFVRRAARAARAPVPDNRGRQRDLGAACDRARGSAERGGVGNRLGGAVNVAMVAITGALVVSPMAVVHASIPVAFLLRPVGPLRLSVGPMHLAVNSLPGTFVAVMTPRAWSAMGAVACGASLAARVARRRR
jgi:hypothetical protein